MVGSCLLRHRVIFSFGCCRRLPVFDFRVFTQSHKQRTLFGRESDNNILVVVVLQRL